MTERYEMLRGAALGEQLPLEARSGLALLLRRGMWAWARTTVTPHTTPRPSQSAIPKSTPNDEQQAVVHLFAAMVTSSIEPRVS